MKYIAIIKARRRLNEAQAHLHRLETAQWFDVEAQHASWYGFVTAAGAVIEILRSSARTDVRARQWIGEIFQKQVRLDPLLRYFYHARGTDFHGSHNSAALIYKDQELAYVGEGSVTYKTADGQEHVSHGVPAILGSGSVEVGETLDFCLVLRPVVDEKNNNEFPAPTSHLGHPLPDNTALTAGKLVLKYYCQIVDQAEAFAS